MCVYCRRRSRRTRHSRDTELRPEPSHWHLTDVILYLITLATHLYPSVSPVEHVHFRLIAIMAGSPRLYPEILSAETRMCTEYDKVLTASRLHDLNIILTPVAVASSCIARRCRLLLPYRDGCDILRPACLYVCLSVSVYARTRIAKPHVQTSLLYMLCYLRPWIGPPLTKIKIRYLLPLLWMTSCFYILVHMQMSSHHSNAVWLWR